MPIPTQMTVIMVFTIMVQPDRPVLLPLQGNQFPESKAQRWVKRKGWGGCCGRGELAKLLFITRFGLEGCSSVEYSSRGCYGYEAWGDLWPPKTQEIHFRIGMIEKLQIPKFCGIAHTFGDRELKSGRDRRGCRIESECGSVWGTWTTFRRFSLKSTESRCYRSCRKPTEVEWKYTEEGERVRVSVRTGRIIPKPVVERRDGVVPQQWKGGLDFGFLCSVIFKPSDLPRGPSFNDSVVLELCVYIRLLSLV